MNEMVAKVHEIGQAYTNLADKRGAIQELT